MAAQASRHDKALSVSFSGMSGQNLAAVDRAVKIVRDLDLDLDHGPGRDDEGTERRRKLLKSLDSGAETAEPDEGSPPGNEPPRKGAKAVANL